MGTIKQLLGEQGPGSDYPDRGCVFFENEMTSNTVKIYEKE